MKKITITILLILSLFTIEINSQEVLQQTTIELRDALDAQRTYLCNATRSIELLPGFNYDPALSNKLVLDIDRYSVYPPSEGMYGGNSENNNDYVVGNIPASFNVSGTGAAVYAVDIQLPQTIGGMSPKLSLIYNNQSANGLLGWSWNLSGLSSIERVGQTVYHDGRTTAVDFRNDRYVLDGQRLMSVGNNVYKKEIDNFDKIVAYTGNVVGIDHFVVWKSDGTIWEYGVTEDSKIEPQTDRSVVYKWLLSKITDRNGNTITYHYCENKIIGEYYIEEIRYASNESMNVSPAYRIVFRYNDRLDPMVGYVNGNKISDNKILKSIEVYNNYSGKKIIDYDLQYNSPGYYDNNYYLHHRLNSIALTIDGKKVSPTRIKWNSKEKWKTDNSCGFKKYELDKTKFNKATFVGDFNGDGLSDVLLVPHKTRNVYSSDFYGEVYLNNGNGSFKNDVFANVYLSKYLEWIYVVDMNGDGVDDIVPYEMHYDEDGVFKQSKYSVWIMNGGVFMNKYSQFYNKPITILPGNFIDKYNNGLLVLDVYDGKKNKNNARYLMHYDGLYLSAEIKNSEVINGKDIDALTMDMSGDGISDLLSLKEDGYVVYKLNQTNGNLYLNAYCAGSSMTKKIFPFPNDYNGDGKTDMLYYDPAHFWNITFSKGNNFLPVEPITNNNLLRDVRLNSKDKYCYSLREIQKPTVTIRTADFDGDGNADIGVFNSSAGNYYLEIGFLVKHLVNGSNELSYYRRYYMPINYSHQTVQLGRFLPQENVSILSVLPRNPSSAAKAYITSICPNSSYYSVEKIIDGMGNSTEFTYDYLFNDNVSKDPFYKCRKNKLYGVEIKPLPILALKEVKSYNVNDKAVVKRYNYENAFVHKTGHGFLGFETVVTRDYIGDELIQKQIQYYKIERMEHHALPMLTGSLLYHGENKILNEKTYDYKKYTCMDNSKVVIPLMLFECESIFDLDKKHVIKKSIYTENTYLSDISMGNSYKDIVSLTKTKKGYNDVKALNFNTCHYIEEENISYDNDIVNWIVNRPKQIIKSVRDKDGNVVGDVLKIKYDVNNPMKVYCEIMIPNVSGNENDSLKLITYYKYDRVGNMIEQKIMSPSLKTSKITKSEYGYKYRYRYKTKSIDEMGREIVCEYNDDFGMLKSTVDFNNFRTTIDNEPFGIESTIVMADGMKNVKAIRWSENNKYAPKNATYYLWEKSVGKSESMIFYHKSGVELRQVTFDLNGEPIFVDKLYDDFGNVKQESYPYYEKDDKLYVSNVYDTYNRKVEVTYPNEMRVTFMYDGNDIKKEYSYADGEKRYEKDTYNVMGWLINTTDNGGNTIKYEYYCDGKMKSSQIGENRNTRITMTYDNRRNRASIYDPNYGMVSYENDALGNVIRIENAQDIIKYEYDVLGRMVAKYEKNLTHNMKKTIVWEYDTSEGRNGTLSKIMTTNNHNIEYEYDDKLRLISTSEHIKDRVFKTNYTYDKANRISSLTHPSGFCVFKKYSNTGYEREIRDAKTQAVLWKTNKTNSMGYITEYQLGNGLKTQYSYDPRNFMIENIVTTRGNVMLQNMEYEYDGKCNMTSRCDLKNYNCEEFEYDSYDRLTKMILNGEVTGMMKYHTNGNITEKTINGVKVMYNTTYAGNKPNAIVSVRSEDEKMYDRFKQKIEYSLDKAISIEDDGDILIMDYGYDNSRMYMAAKIDGKIKEKFYVGNCEFVIDDNKANYLTYLEGPMGVFAVCVSNSSTSTVNYIHKDNLESWNIITDKDGKVIEERNFDAWGNMRDSKTWSKDADIKTLMFDRGFTGHEHLVSFGLINMNGRLYDPLTSMMLSPDNNIQMPKNSQNFNRYSYCLNNPLKYTDPTGEVVESVVFGVVGGATNMLLNAKNIDSFGEAALLFGVGFVQGFLTEYTLGQSWLLQVGLNAATRGLVSGANLMVGVSDGDFGLTGDDWNSVKKASLYGLGSGLVKSFMYSYWIEPTDEQYGMSLFEACEYQEFIHGVTSLAAHGMGCWFSGKQFLPTMRFRDIGIDLRMLGIVAERMFASYMHNKSDFGDKVLQKRAQEINESLLQEMRVEMPETPEFGYEYHMIGAFIEDFRLYIVGNIHQYIPNERGFFAPKPYFEELFVFPFNYSLFKTLFFKEE